MNKTIKVFLGLSICTFALFGCSSEKSSSLSANEGQDNNEKLSVYTSFYPMYDFALKIGGDKINATNMVPVGTEPHDWEPTAYDITGLETADVFIFNGAGLEHWVEDVLETLQNEKLVSTEASKGISLLEGTSHNEDGNEAENAEKEHSEGFDPHVWLSPKNAKKEMENIKNTFVSADPENSDYYNENFEKYSSELDKLDEEFKNTISSLPNKEIVVSHQAFGYLCSDYGLIQVPIEGLSPDSEPDPARVAEIIDFAKEHNVKVIFFEELASPKVAKSIADSINAETDVLNPIEGLSDEEMANGDDYFSVMRKNLESIKSALE